MSPRRLIGFVGRLLPRVVFMVVVSAALLGLPAAIDRGPETTLVSLEPTPERARNLDELELELTLVARVPRPTAMAVRRNDDALYVTSKRGYVYAIGNGEPEVVLDIRDEISGGFEQGLLGITFTPDGQQMILNFTNSDDSSVTRAYVIEDGKPDPSSGTDLLVVKKPAKIHNAGNVAFGPDDYLYLSLGDGGLPGDVTGNAQSLKSLLGKIHRIEVRPDGTYSVPKDNPFVGRRKARDEIWAYGFRNPWRFSFDRRTGDLWIADVGRGRYEEINRQPSAAPGGRNYGWNHFEGPAPHNDDRIGERKELRIHVPPVHWYRHIDDRCSVTGGYVYRGTRIAGLEGAYLYSDYCKGGIDAIRLDGDDVTDERLFDIDVAQVASFGEDADGELYVLTLSDDAVYRIDPRRRQGTD